MSDWIKTNLNDIIIIVGGGTPKTEVRAFWNGHIPWISVVDFSKSQRWILHTEKSITKEGLENSSTRLLNENDIIISARGTVGEIAQLKKPMAFNQSCYGIKAKLSIVDVDFLYFLLKYSIEKLKKNTHGSVFQTITQNTFKDIEVIIPKDILEQKQIASVLNCIDKKIENLKKQNTHLENIAQTLFKHWFIDFEFPDINGKPYKSSGGKMIESEMGLIPDKWKVGSLKDEFNILMGQSPSGTSFNENGNGLVFYQGRTDFGERFPTIRLYTTQEKRIAMPGDVLVSVRAPVGDINVSFEKCCIGRGLAAVKSINKSYCLYKMQSLKARLQVFDKEGTVFGSLNKENFNDLEVIIPEPAKILKFDSMAKILDSKILNNEKIMRRLNNIYKTILPKLMSGQIRIK